MRLNPGDKVRITQYAFDNIDVQDIIVATKGSIGTVLDYREYYDYYVIKPFSDDHYLSLVRKWIDDCEHIPSDLIRLCRFQRIFLLLGDHQDRSS